MLPAVAEQRIGAGLIVDHGRQFFPGAVVEEGVEKFTPGHLAAYQTSGSLAAGGTHRLERLPVGGIVIKQGKRGKTGIHS